MHHCLPGLKIWVLSDRICITLKIFHLEKFSSNVGLHARVQWKCSKHATCTSIGVIVNRYKLRGERIQQTVVISDVISDAVYHITASDWSLT